MQPWPDDADVLAVGRWTLDVGIRRRIQLPLPVRDSDSPKHGSPSLPSHVTELKLFSRPRAVFCGASLGRPPDKQAVAATADPWTGLSRMPIKGRLQDEHYVLRALLVRTVPAIVDIRKSCPRHHRLPPRIPNSSARIFLSLTPYCRTAATEAPLPALPAR